MVKLLGPAEVRALAARLDLTPTKKLGQNFVIDGNTVRRIVAAAGVTAGERVMEIGPGLGSLTLGLIEAGASVTAVEIDRRLAELLPETLAAMGAPAGSYDVVRADAMEVMPDPLRLTALAQGGEVDDPSALVANLPYNVSVPVLLHVLEHFPTIRRGLVMVQAEVGQRLAAAPGSKIYGSPSAKAAWYAEVRLAGQIGRQVFWPAPNVDSILVRLDRRAEPGDERDRRETFAIVDAAFGQRRKMLRQSLVPVLGAGASAIIERAGVDPTARGEVLTILDFLRIALAARSA
ncbi:MAG TPA: 16S rRNA (adenine(1518)-N(6)/adenine(1519)-N(6))-dimethyltransferase RsmA [Microbacteriaceae bacterium]|nr:16S rRNA (adenine(1518)-N(6)/adenine(1519)-N(6))-dimethyltransferase RsmA [Microbacteriaceae bacterium]